VRTNRHIPLLVLVLVTFALSSGPSLAGWITLKNETRTELVVQPIVTINGRERLGKAIKLMPGETLKQWEAAPGSRTIQLYDPANANRSVIRSRLEWSTADATYTVAETAGVLKLSLQKPPAVTSR
jgi:hypothetical protein